MPRKQRFKPSRKPAPSTTTIPANPQVDDRREIHPDDVEIEVGSTSRSAERAHHHSESERSG